METKEFKHEVKAYCAPQSTVIALVAKQTLLAGSDPEEAGSPGEDDPYFNDYGTI